MASSSSSSSRRSWGWTYDVFLSFRGEDTRTNFVDHLYNALDGSSICTFVDRKLRRGESISAGLLKSIEQSRFAVVVFSKNYADSSWCLDELVKIVDCKNSIGQTLIPVFYDVDPSEVRNQKRGHYQKAFVKHESSAYNSKKQKERVKRWRKALEEAANISGWDLPKTSHGHESQCIKQIVSNILSNLGHSTTSSMAEDLIGIESRMQKVKSVLCMGSDNIRIIGIWGMGGMGKTTIARAVFDECLYLFEGTCFVANVREVSERHGLHSLQEKILSAILMEKDLKIADVYEGIGMMSRKLSGKRVLIVLDDVDKVNQLEALARKREWFGRGSRIVITTRDKQVLLVGNRVDEIHTLDLFNDDEALKLFSKYAFCQNSPQEEFVKSSQLVVRYAGGLPLPLKVLGSFLCGRDIIEWTSALDRLKDTPEKEIEDILKTSFEGLKDVEKKIFLDIACFFKGMKKDEVTPILDSFDFHPDIGISVLVQRCLVSVSDKGVLEMHDLIQEMGWHMAHNTRLWSSKHGCDLFSKNTGMEAIEAIKLCWSYPKMQFSWEPLRHMEKLRLLDVVVIHDDGFYEGPEDLSNELRWICWYGYPSKFLPESFLAEKLVCLKMPHSKIVQLWKGEKLPPNWHNKITGFAMCVAFGGHPLVVDGHIYIGGVGEVVGTTFRVQPEMHRRAYDGHILMGIVSLDILHQKDDHIWMGYVSLDLLHQKALPDRHKDDWLGTEQDAGYLCISFSKIWGMRNARLVFKEDVLKQRQMMIEDTSLSPGTWALDYPFCWDFFPHTITRSDFKRLVDENC